MFFCMTKAWLRPASVISTANFTPSHHDALQAAITLHLALLCCAFRAYFAFRLTWQARVRGHGVQIMCSAQLDSHALRSWRRRAQVHPCSADVALKSCCACAHVSYLCRGPSAAQSTI